MLRTADTEETKYWQISQRVDNKAVSFKIYTGADISVMPGHIQGTTQSYFSTIIKTSFGFWREPPHNKRKVYGYSQVVHIIQGLQEFSLETTSYKESRYFPEITVCMTR